MPHEYWLDLLSSSEYGKIDISDIKDNILVLNKLRFITVGKYLKNLSMILEFGLPLERLVIELNNPLNEEEEQDLVNLMSTIKRNFRKDLHIQLKDSYENFKPIRDDFFKELKEAQ